MRDSSCVGMEPRRTRQVENGHANGSRWQDDYDESIINELLQGREDPSLKRLDMGVIKRETFERTRSAMAVGKNVNIRIHHYFVSNTPILKLPPGFSASRNYLFMYCFYVPKNRIKNI